MGKKILSLLLAAMLCVGLVSPGLTAEAGYTVTPGGSQVHTWAGGEISRAESAGLVPAPLAGKDLTGPITRAQFASVAVRLYEAMQGKAAQTGSAPFTDIGGPDGVYYADICKAYSLELVNGTTSTTFEPDSFLTREAAATMLARVYGKLVGPIPAGSLSFGDSGEVSDWARDSVAFMAGKGIVKGVDNSRFAPKAVVTAEQAIILALRMKTSTSAGTSGQQGSIVGIWEISMEMADQMNQQFTAAGLGDYIKLDSFAVVGRYIFNSDGTYRFAVDESALKKSIEDMRKVMKNGMNAYVEDLIAAKGLEGVMTPEDVFAAMGMDVDKMLDEIFAEADMAGVVERSGAEGNYKATDGKLYLSDGLDHSIDENMYHNYTIEGDTLTIVDMVGGDESDAAMYPITLKKVG